MSATVAVSHPIIRQTQEQEPPMYILQSWRREQANSRDQYLLDQTFVVAPDTAVPASKFRRHIRNIYEERIRSTIVVHYDPWTIEASSATQSKPTAEKDLSVNIDVVRSHTVL